MPRLENDKRGGGGFVYRKRDPKTIFDLAKRQGGNSNQPFKKQFVVWRPQNGLNTIRILPPTWEGDHYALTIYVHRFIGASNDSFLCLAKHQQKRCPCCEASQEARQASQNEEAYSLSAKEQRLVWILDRKAKDNKTPQLYMYSWKMDQQIAEQSGDEEAGKVIWIDNPDTGRDIRVRKSGSGITTTYIPALAAEPSAIAERTKDYEGITKYIENNPLPDVLFFHTPKDMESALAGVGEEKDELDDAMNDKTSRGKAKTTDEPPRRRGKVVDDDEEDDENENEKPRARRAKRDEKEEDEIPEDEVSDDHDHEEEEAQADKRRLRSRAKYEDKDEIEDEKPQRRRAAAVLDEDEDEEPRKRRGAKDEDDVEEEKEEDRPVKKKVQVKGKHRNDPAEEDELEDDEEEEEEEDEKPRQKSTRERAR